MEAEQVREIKKNTVKKRNPNHLIVVWIFFWSGLLPYFH